MHEGEIVIRVESDGSAYVCQIEFVWRGEHVAIVFHDENAAVGLARGLRDAFPDLLQKVLKEPWGHGKDQDA